MTRKDYGVAPAANQDLIRLLDLSAYFPNGNPASLPSYTPAWTAVTTNPTIGNGSRSAVYYQVGKMVFCKGFLQAGSTTTFGTGAYSLSLPPIDANVDYGSVAPHGSARFLDASSGLMYHGTVLVPTLNTFQIVGVGGTYAAATHTWAPTVPVTMAVSDYVSWSFWYEAE